MGARYQKIGTSFLHMFLFIDFSLNLKNTVSHFGINFMTELLVSVRLSVLPTNQ